MIPKITISFKSTNINIKRPSKIIIISTLYYKEYLTG